MTSSLELDIDTFQEAIKTLGDGVAIYGPDDYPIYTNSACGRSFALFYADMDAGFTYREALVRSVRRRLPKESAEAIDGIADEQMRNFRLGGTYSAFSEEGRMMQITFRNMSRGLKVAISVDVTVLRMRERELVKRGKELERAHKAAEAASASKSTFLANMSHEIRTPLNGIMGLAQVLEGADLDPQCREHVATILDCGKTLMALLNDVLDLSKIEAGKFDIVASDANVEHLFRRQLKLWKPLAEEKGLTLTLTFDAELPAELSFDQIRVQQCISNLVSNAIKFTDQGRVEIFVSAAPQPDGDHLVVINVADTGPGMDAETLSLLFQPFVQADQTTQRKHGGTGLGLSITRRLAELMGGTVSATSEPGRGSTFSISFRAAPAQVRNRTVELDHANQTNDAREYLKFSNLRVLLVDDLPINRQIASLFLQPFNIRIVEAANGVEALAALELDSFDVVLLDVHMPVMDGPTTIQQIRDSGQSWATIPVIVLTADAMSGDRKRYFGMGMDGYLSKPLAERDLVSEIACVVSAARARCASSKKWHNSQRKLAEH
tara:strand:+ start:14056 stop:15705 length:1650 start_codon:yes stop_codon:yes gene_type:complete